MKRKTRKPRQVRKTGRQKTRKSTIIDIDEFYQLMNHVQMEREEVSFAIKNEDTSMIDNLLKDLELPYDKTGKRTHARYTVSPGKERLIEESTEEEIVEEFPDEIAEDGQIFF